MKFIRNNAIGLLALTIALGGTAIAAGPLAHTSKTKTTIRQLQVPLEDPDGTGTVKVSCKANERVTGGGYRFAPPSDIRNSTIVTSAPIDSRTWAVEAANTDNGPWSGVVQAYAVCAKR